MAIEKVIITYEYSEEKIDNRENICNSINRIIIFGYIKDNITLKIQNSNIFNDFSMRILK